jgi:phenylpyruvate tautomerase PptA (4-oxalocrotonate tautomerase family)
MIIEIDRFMLRYPTMHQRIEFSTIEGRSIETKKKLINLLFQRIESEIGILPNGIEITITETPAYNWGFRGKPGEEHTLNYKIDV